MDISLLWLHEEFYQDIVCSYRQAEYNRWCEIILDALRDGFEFGDEVVNGLDVKDRSFTRFLVEIPELGDTSLDRIKEYCEESSRYIHKLSLGCC
jgi:symplekin